MVEGPWLEAQRINVSLFPAPPPHPPLHLVKDITYLGKGVRPLLVRVIPVRSDHVVAVASEDLFFRQLHELLRHRTAHHYVLEVSSQHSYAYGCALEQQLEYVGRFKFPGDWHHRRHLLLTNEAYPVFD